MVDRTISKALTFLNSHIIFELFTVYPFSEIINVFNECLHIIFKRDTVI